MTRKKEMEMTVEPSMEKQLKSSQFNEYLGNISDKWVIANHLSGGIIEVNPRIFKALQGNHVAKIKDEEHVQALRYGNFIVDADLNEVEALKKKRQEWSDTVKVIGLQIVPTLACNFRCPYCYENQGEKNSLISKEVMDSIVNHVQETMQPTTRALNISWYGGEPLLAVKQIEYLSGALFKLCMENKIEYRSSIITNGFLLDKQNVDTLLKYNLRSLQVTLDGPKDVHDKRRILHDGSGTWQVIVDNLKYVLEKKVGVMVRINVDKTNIDSIERLFQELQTEGIFSRISISFGAVLAFGNVCRSVEDNLISFEEAEKKIGQEKIQSLLKNSQSYSRRFTPNFLGCVAVARNSFIVGPSGELYKCSKTIGSDGEICGHISNIDRNNPNLKKWEGITNLDDQTCSKCSVVPICSGGGCAFDYVINGKEMISCDTKKFRIGYIENLKGLYRKNKTL